MKKRRFHKCCSAIVKILSHAANNSCIPCTTLSFRLSSSLVLLSRVIPAIAADWPEKGTAELVMTPSPLEGRLSVGHILLLLEIRIYNIVSARKSNGRKQL